MNAHEASSSPDRTATVSRALSIVAALCWAVLVWPLLLSLNAKMHRPALYAFVAFVAVSAGVPVVARGVERAMLAPSRPVFVTLVALAQVALTEASLRMIARGHTMSPDGAVYWFQARALAHGSFGTPLEFPRQNWSMRFLFEGADGLLHGVFPPGWPLFLAPFVRAGRPFAAGWVVAVLLAWGTYELARALGANDRWSEDETHDQRARELVARTAALLPIPCFVRAAETTDLLSHAFVGALGAFAFVGALSLRSLSTEGGSANERRWMVRSATTSALVFWAFSARLLDGLVLGLFVVPLALASIARAYRAGARRIAGRSLLVAVLAAAPFVLLVAAHQKRATGSWSTPTQREYFARSDWSPTCHRLGFGRDVGCEVEHGDDRAAMGPNGYTPKIAFNVVRSRAIVLGDDLVSPGQWIALALLLVALRPARRAALASVFIVAFTLAYGLFYYGNAPLFGARHLFPLAPFVWFLLARASAMPAAKWPKVAPQGAVALAILCSCYVGQAMRWMVIPALEGELRERRPWVRPVIERAANPQGIIVATDVFHAITGYDPWTDRGQRVVVVSDDAGLRELRRARPEWTVWYPTENNTLARLGMPPPRDDLSVELESAWPSFQWPSGLKASRFEVFKWSPSFVASGAHVLRLEHAQPGSRLRVRFELAGAGRRRVYITGFAGPDYGDYLVRWDGRALMTIRGYAPVLGPTRSVSEPVEITRGAHEVTFECVGRDPSSTGYDGALDALVARSEP